MSTEKCANRNIVFKILLEDTVVKYKCEGHLCRDKPMELLDNVNLLLQGSCSAPATWGRTLGGVRECKFTLTLAGEKWHRKHQPATEDLRSDTFPTETGDFRSLDVCIIHACSPLCQANPDLTKVRRVGMSRQDASHTSLHHLHTADFTTIYSFQLQAGTG